MPASALRRQIRDMCAERLCVPPGKPVKARGVSWRPSRNPPLPRTCHQPGAKRVCPSDVPSRHSCSKYHQAHLGTTGPGLQVVCLRNAHPGLAARRSARRRQPSSKQGGAEISSDPCGKATWPAGHDSDLRFPFGSTLFCWNLPSSAGPSRLPRLPTTNKHRLDTGPIRISGSPCVACKGPTLARDRPVDGPLNGTVCDVVGHVLGSWAPASRWCLCLRAWLPYQEG